MNRPVMNPMRSCRTSMPRVIRNILSSSGCVWWRRRCCVAVGVSVGWVGGALGQPGLALPARQSADSLAGGRAWAGITTDTGEYAPGYHDFSRYTTIPMCMIAVQSELLYQRRTAALRVAVDSLQRTAPWDDTLPQAVRRVARGCGTPFLAQAATATTNLSPLYSLALLMGEDSLAARILARRVGLMSSDVQRQVVELNAIDTLLAAEPSRVAAATALLARLDRAGPAALQTRILAHQRFLAFGTQTFDRARMRTEAEALLALLPEPDPQRSASQNGAVIQQRQAAYAALGRVDWFDAPDSLPVLVARIRQDLQRPGWTAFTALRTAPVDTLLAWAHVPSVPGQGPLTPRLTATYWFPPPGTPASDTLQPAPGTVSLFVRPLTVCANPALWDIAEVGDVSDCDLLVATLARWQQQYGARGLRLTIVTWDVGSARYSGRLAPAMEAQSMARYWQDDMHVPVLVAVQTVPMAHHPPPYPTIYPTESLPWVMTEEGGNWYPNNDLIRIVVTGRDGRLLYAGSDKPDDWKPDNAMSMVDMLLAHLFAPSPATAAAASPRPAPFTAQAP